MGKVFKKVFKPIQKLVPKGLRPYVPYAAAFIPGGMGLSAGLQSMGGSAFLKAAIARGMIDPDASIGDSLKTGLMAAAPQAIGKGLGTLGTKYGSPSTTNALLKSISKGSTGASKVPFSETLGNLATTASGSPYLNPEFTPDKLMSTAKVAGTLGTVEAAAQLAELNQEEIDKYNDSLGGNLDRGERRAQLTAIFTRAGYQPDYVDQMLTTYGYAQGGIAGLRSGYDEGGTVTITQKEYDRLTKGMNSSEGLGFASEGLNMLNKSGHNTEPVPMLRFARGGEVEEVEDIDSTYTSSGAGFNVDDGTDAQFAGLYKDTVGKRYPEISIDSELARRARKYMQMGGIESAEAAYSLAEQELTEDIMSEYPNLTSSMGMARGGEVVEESETLMAGGPYTTGRDVEDAFGIWNGMGIEDKSLFEGFLDFYKQGSWRDQIQGSVEVEEDTMMASGPGPLGGDYDDISMSLFGKRYKQLLPDEMEQMQEYLQSNMPVDAAQGGIMNRNLLNTGMDKDMRSGGFVPEGTKEKADDVPARLSKNEFVMTADAVRAAGGGSVNKGAQRMYNIMNQLEAKA